MSFQHTLVVLLAAVTLLLLAGCTAVTTPTATATDSSGDWRSDLERDLNTTYTNESAVRPSRVAEVETEILEFINAQRAARGIEPLRYSANMSRLNRWYAREGARRDGLDHDNPKTGRNSWERAEWAGIDDCRLYIEVNTITTYHAKYPAGTAREVVKNYMLSDGHREGLYNPDAQVAGVGSFVSDTSQIQPNKPYIYTVVTMCDKQGVTDADIDGWENATYRDGTIAVPYDAAVDGEYDTNYRRVDDENSPFPRPENGTTATAPG